MNMSTCEWMTIFFQLLIDVKNFQENHNIWYLEVRNMVCFQFETDALKFFFIYKYIIVLFHKVRIKGVEFLYRLQSAQAHINIFI
jgi:hypothetical protein